MEYSSLVTLPSTMYKVFLHYIYARLSRYDVQLVPDLTTEARFIPNSNKYFNIRPCSLIFFPNFKWCLVEGFTIGWTVGLKWYLQN